MKITDTMTTVTEHASNRRHTFTRRPGVRALWATASGNVITAGTLQQIIDRGIKYRGHKYTSA